MVESVIDELSLRQYKEQSGVYFIQCYDGVIKIGCSSDIQGRLLSYQGVYWQNKILKIWLCNSPLFLEQQLHLVLGIELKQIRKGKYELFKLSETETQNLEQIVDLIDQRAQQIMAEMEKSGGQSIQEVDMIQCQLDRLENMSISESQSTNMAPSVQESQTAGNRQPCKFNGCVKKTTKGYCFKHHPDNVDYNQQKYKEHSEKQKNKILGYMTQIKELTGQIEDLQNEISELKQQLSASSK